MQSEIASLNIDLPAKGTMMSEHLRNSPNQKNSKVDCSVIIFLLSVEVLSGRVPWYYRQFGSSCLTPMPSSLRNVRLMGLTNNDLSTSLLSRHHDTALAMLIAVRYHARGSNVVSLLRTCDKAFGYSFIIML